MAKSQRPPGRLKPVPPDVRKVTEAPVASFRSQYPRVSSGTMTLMAEVRVPVRTMKAFRPGESEVAEALTTLR